MKILCPVKFTPDVDSFVYDYENRRLITESSKRVIGPDDASALGFALRLKKENPGIEIEVLTMAPSDILHYAEDIARRRIDRMTILSDPRFALSDTLATSRVLARYISGQNFDVILTGCRSLDGDTGHVPAGIAAFLGLEYMSGITRIDQASFLDGEPEVRVDTELDTQVYKIHLPAVLGISARSGYKLPFVRYADLDLDVKDRISILGAEELKLSAQQAGEDGSATKVVRTYTEEYADKKDRMMLRDDDEGVEAVWRFLKEKGYLK